MLRQFFPGLLELERAGFVVVMPDPAVPIFVEAHASQFAEAGFQPPKVTDGVVQAGGLEQFARRCCQQRLIRHHRLLPCMKTGGQTGRHMHGSSRIGAQKASAAKQTPPAPTLWEQSCRRCVVVTRSDSAEARIGVFQHSLDIGLLPGLFDRFYPFCPQALRVSVRRSARPTQVVRLMASWRTVQDAERRVYPENESVIFLRRASEVVITDARTGHSLAASVDATDASLSDGEMQAVYLTSARSGSIRVAATNGTIWGGSI